jgi:hypothetical protein
MFASSIRRAAPRSLAKLSSVATKESRQTIMMGMTASFHRPLSSQLMMANNNNRLENNGHHAGRLFFSATIMPEDELNKRLLAFTDLFVEARMCLEDVADSAETTYFDEDADAAMEAVAAAVDEFNSIINDIGDADQKNRVLRSNGLKVEQLKGELEMAIKGGH